MASAPRVPGWEGRGASRPCRCAGARRSLSLCAAALALAATSCSPSVAPKPLAINVLAAWTTRTVDHRQVSLSVPSNWNIGQAWVVPGSFVDLIGSFSNQPLSPPCTTSGNSIACGPPLQSLQPGGILVDVYNNGAPTWSLSSEPGVPATVSRLSAKVDVGTGGDQCSGLGADRSRTEFIALSTPPEDYFEVSICSRGVPDDVGSRVMASVRVALLG
jgi:hypothetical protein